MATAHELIQQGMEKGIEKGMERGILAGRRQTLRRLLQLRFGALPENVIARVDGADAATLDRWEGRVLTAATLDDALSTP
jgi:hypothetical protein